MYQFFINNNYKRLEKLLTLQENCYYYSFKNFQAVIENIEWIKEPVSIIVVVGLNVPPYIANNQLAGTIIFNDPQSLAVKKVYEILVHNDSKDILKLANF